MIFINDVSVDFITMTQVVNGKILKIQKLETNLRSRHSCSDYHRYQKDIFGSKRQRKYDINGLQWLSENYKKKYGLRKWSWATIINGVIQENLKVLGEMNGAKTPEGVYQVKLIWRSFANVAGIEDLKVVPVTDDPQHKHVKAILFMYSLESFLFKRINQSSRDQDLDAIETLGPYAVALSKVINQVESKRKSIEGKFVCYSGLALSRDLIEEWTKKKYV